MLWILNVHSTFFEKSSTVYSICNLSNILKFCYVALPGDNSSSDRDKNSDEFSEMEGTLKSNEENTGDTVEGKTENSEDSEVSHDVSNVTHTLYCNELYCNECVIQPLAAMFIQINYLSIYLEGVGGIFPC